MKNHKNIKRYIVVEGPVGVGKTTLARRLTASLGAAVLLEQPTENPFLERFYRSPDKYALQTQLFFLFQRVRQLRQLRQRDFLTPAYVADFMLAKDPMFARITLDQDELYLYEQVYNQLALEVPQPDLVIYLQAPTATLIGRIRKRGIMFERYMERHYLEQLAEAYTRFFLAYHESPLLIVNADNLDLLQNEDHYQMLLNQIDRVRLGRHFFNPVV